MNSSDIDDVMSSDELKAIFKQLGYNIDDIAEQIEQIVKEWTEEKYRIDFDNDTNR